MVNNFQMTRRGMVGTILAATATFSAGCLGEGEETAEAAEESTEPSDSSLDGSGSSAEDTEEECHTEIETKTESIVSTSEGIEGWYEWAHEYRVERDDTVHFNINTSDGQDVDVKIESPDGSVLHEENGISIDTTEHFSNGGRGEVRVLNDGDRTETETESIVDDREDVSAGATLNQRIELQEGQVLDYWVRKVGGARPELRIESEDGQTVREHSVSEVIDGEYEIPEDGRYYIYMENTALMTSATWDYTLDLNQEVPIATTVDLEIEREFEEEVEVCE